MPKSAGYILPLTDIKHFSIKLYFIQHEQIIFDAEIIPSCYAKYTFKEKKYYLENSLLVPGFINGHTHSFESLFQGLYSFDRYKDGLFDKNNMLDWLLSSPKGLLPIVISTCKNANIINEIIQENIWRLAYRKNIFDQVKSGVTYFRDHMWNMGNIIEGAYEENKLLKIDHILAIDCSPSVENTFKKAKDIIEKQRDSSVIFEVAGTDNDLLGYFEKVKEISEEYQIGIHLHFCETMLQKKSYFNITPVKYLQQQKILGTNTSLAHCVNIDEEEYNILYETGTKVVVNNRANAYLGSGKCNMIDLMNHGVECYFGSDGPASIGINMLSLLKESLLMERIISRNPSIIDAYDVLNLVTYGAAKYIGLESMMGSIEENKKANFLISLLNQPVFDPVNSFIYLSTEDDIISVCINGIEKKSGRQVIDIDKISLNEKLGKVSEYLMKKIGNN